MRQLDGSSAEMRLNSVSLNVTSSQPRPIHAASTTLSIDLPHFTCLTDSIMSTPNKLGTKMTSDQQAALVARTGVAPPPPVIPTTWLAPHEQRFAVLAVFGLVEVGRVVAPPAVERRLDLYLVEVLIAGDESLGHSAPLPPVHRP